MKRIVITISVSTENEAVKNNAKRFASAHLSNTDNKEKVKEKLSKLVNLHWGAF